MGFKVHKSHRPVRKYVFLGKGFGTSIKFTFTGRPSSHEAPRPREELGGTMVASVFWGSLAS